MKIRAIVGAALLAGGAGLGMSACSSGPSSGYVWAKNYTPASQTWFPGYYVPETCSSSKYGTSCSGGYYVPGYFMYFPQEWQFHICTEPLSKFDKKNSCGDINVDEHDYDTTSIGKYYGTPPVAAPKARKVPKK